MTTDTLIGQTLGKYKVTEHLGRGGMAEVYKGYRADLDRTVAIKLMHSFLSAEQDFLFRFKREARAMAKMRHPNIVSVYDFDVYGKDTYYLVMEYIGGGTLKEKLTKLAQNGERLPLEHAVRIALEVAEALTYAHGREMVHRDIKPGNIMLDERGKAILTDFGIVKLVGGQSMAYTATGALIGTPAYMSPEQALGKPGDARSDLYSLGILLFQMVTGQLPFSADTPLAVVMKHVNDPVPLPVAFNPDVPQGLQEIILKALAKEPEERYQSAKQLVAALRNVDLSAAPAEATREAVVPVADLDPQDTPASRTSVASTAVADLAPTEVVSDRTAVGRTVTAPPAVEARKERSPWIYIAGALILLLGGAGALFAVGVIPGLRADPTPTVPVIVQQPTNTATSQPEATSTPSVPVDTPVPIDTPDVVASSVAAIAQTAAAQATNTPTVTSTPTRRPTATATSTITPSPDLTASFLETCTNEVELVSTYTYRASTSSAPVSVSFPVNWVLRNSGTCPWPTDLTWSYVEGAEFGYDGTPIALETGLVATQEITLNATFVAPGNNGRFDSTWRLLDAEGAPFGPPLTFELLIYVPATPTPRPSPTPQVQPTPTAEVTQLDWIYVLSNCEYIGIEWRCMMLMTPYGGGGGPYTMWVFDATQPAEYRGPGPFTHFVKARRCSPYIHEVRLQDDATGTSFSKNIFIDPNAQFIGGCVLPP